MKVLTVRSSRERQTGLCSQLLSGGCACLLSSRNSTGNLSRSRMRACPSLTGFVASAKACILRERCSPRLTRLRPAPCAFGARLPSFLRKRERISALQHRAQVGAWLRVVRSRRRIPSAKMQRAVRPGGGLRCNSWSKLWHYSGASAVTARRFYCFILLIKEVE